FVDRKYPPIDKIYLVEINNEVERRWLPKSYSVQQIIGTTIMGTMIFGLEEAKEFYNANYDEILESIYPEFLLQKPAEIDGFYLDSETGEIEQTGLSYKNGGFGVTYSYEQAEGVVAFCELTQLLPAFNEGWEPEWSYSAGIKWVIVKIKGGFNVRCEYSGRKLLAFKTKEKAELFLMLKKPLISALSDAGII
ncbi:hypothetical protein BSPWISOXPB_4310, partial [uncultured Gammaproteobacteria bacterium]